METTYCTLTVPVKKRNNIIYLDDFRAGGQGVSQREAGAPSARLPKRRSQEGKCPALRAVRLPDLGELISTLSVVAVMALLAVRILVF